MKFLAKYSDTQTFDYGGKRYRFQGGIFETEDKKMIEYLKNSKGCVPECTEEDCKIDIKETPKAVKNENRRTK